MTAPLELNAIVERHAQLEKRAMLLYRGLAERFHGHAEASRIWRELSNTEASHFALLELTQDWITMAGAATTSAPRGDSLEAAASGAPTLEAAAGDCEIERAVDLSLQWEELELPRVLELVAGLPARAQARVMAGLIAESAEHYRILMELVKVAGTPEQAPRVSALAEGARAALG